MLTIGSRFGGALDEAASMFSNARDTGLTPREFVDESRKANKLSACRAPSALAPAAHRRAQWQRRGFRHRPAATSSKRAAQPIRDARVGSAARGRAHASRTCPRARSWQFRGGWRWTTRTSRASAGWLGAQRRSSRWSLQTCWWVCNAQVEAAVAARNLKEKLDLVYPHVPGSREGGEKM